MWFFGSVGALICCWSAHTLASKLLHAEALKFPYICELEYTYILHNVIRGVLADLGWYWTNPRGAPLPKYKGEEGVPSQNLEGL